MKVKIFEANFETVYLRFVLMMVTVIVPFFIGYPGIALLAVPIFLSAILGMKFELSALTEVQSEEAKQIAFLPKRTSKVA